jgi:uncharacterized membrane protein YkvI
MIAVVMLAVYTAAVSLIYAATATAAPALAKDPVCFVAVVALLLFPALVAAWILHRRRRA